MRTATPRRAPLAWALLFLGCIGLESAYDDCVSSGRCQEPDAGGADAAVSDAGQGGSDASGSDAGQGADGGGLPDTGLADAGTGPTDAGPDAGLADAGTGPTDAGSADAGIYDGGPPCGQSTHPKLRCDAPFDLGTGSGINGSAMAATSSGFIAAWVGATAEVREVHLDHSMTTLVTGAPVSGAQIAVDAKGARWVVAWSDQGASTAQCATSASDAGTPAAVNAGGPIGVLNVATSAAGAVGVAAVTSSGFVGAHSAAGCPGALTLINSSVNSVGVVSTSAPGGDGFRYVWTDQINLYNGFISIASREADGGVTEVSAPVSLSAPSGMAAVASTSGATVLTAFSEFNTSNVYDLGLWGTSANLSNDGAPTLISSIDPGWWTLATCGDGCVATGVIAHDLPGPAVISFFSDDPQIRPRGTWDAVCSLQPQNVSGSSLSVANFGGRLGVMLTTATSAKLYLCDIPPLP